jgi:AmmeMemoRadiSam system protein B
LTNCKKYSTVLGDITIDIEEVKALYSTNKNDYISLLDLSVDEAEHSLEMQLPFLKYIFGEKDFLLLPIMIGDTNSELDKKLSKLLLKYYLDPETLFVISSDFCHWGKRFDYTYYNKQFNTIHESIEDLDRKGMDSISTLSCENFNNYLKQYGNTICGERPISVLLATIEEYKILNEMSGKIEFAKYDQSEKVTKPSGSSVSYAVGLHIIN